MVEPLKLHGVGRRYGPRSPWVIRGLDLELSPGSITKIDGANGSGKSTLLALIAGISRPTRGRVTCGGRRAYVPERLPTLLPYDVFGYLERLGSAHGLTLDEGRRRASYWLDRLGAAQWAKAPMATLSSGTAQKVALTQALMADADWLILDEPWTGLDQVARQVFDEALRERTAAGASIVYVGHEHTGYLDAAATTFLIRSGTLAPAARRATPDIVPAAAPAPARALARTLPPPRPMIEIEYDDGSTTHVLRVDASDSDDALREVLALPRHHVRLVRPLAASR